MDSRKHTTNLFHEEYPPKLEQKLFELWLIVIGSEQQFPVFKFVYQSSLCVYDHHSSTQLELYQSNLRTNVHKSNNMQRAEVHLPKHFRLIKVDYNVMIIHLLKQFSNFYFEIEKKSQNKRWLPKQNVWTAKKNTKTNIVPVFVKPYKKHI